MRAILYQVTTHFALVMLFHPTSQIMAWRLNSADASIGLTPPGSLGRSLPAASLIMLALFRILFIISIYEFYKMTSESMAQDCSARQRPAEKTHVMPRNNSMMPIAHGWRSFTQ
jgi:hypothetical protein